MHQHDQELIMALAEGGLDADAAATARAEVASCPECSRDLELQRIALQGLEGLPRAHMTELESTRLRRSLREELGIARDARVTPAKRRRMPMAAFATAAAVLLAVVVAAPTLNLIGGGDDGADATIVADATAGATATTAGAVAEMAPLGDGGAGDSFDTQAATTIAPPPEASGQMLYGYFIDETDLDELRSSAAGTGFDEEASRSQALRMADDSVLDEGPDDADACIAVTVTSEENLVGGYQIARGTYQGRDVLYVIYVAEDPAESILLVHAADNCEEIGRAGP